VVFWVKVTLAILLAIAGVLAVLLWVGTIRNDRAATRIEDELIQQAHAARGTGATVNFAELDHLPGVVARYLRFALRDGQPTIRMARFSQIGELRTDDRSDHWSAYRADQIVTPVPPAFVWDARVRVAPLLHVRVRDAYVGGRGVGQVSLLSAISLSQEQGGAELNAGELYRYLAEAVWFPTALLPSAGVRWTPIDDSKALATLTHAATTVSVEFRFGDLGEVTGIYTPARGRRVGSNYQPTPWEGHHLQYIERDGMRVPTQGDVGWYLNGEWQPVWRGTITSATYEFAQVVFFVTVPESFPRCRPRNSRVLGGAGPS
jgi:hypothetical protein